MNNELQHALVQKLNELSAKLGTTVDRLWAVLVQQARITAITDGIELVVCLALSVFCAKLAWWGFNQIYEKKPGYREDWTTQTSLRFTLGIFASAALLPLFIMIAVLFPAAMTELFNPQYWALQHLFEAIR
jgi:hypothetical protein